MQRIEFMSAGLRLLALLTVIAGPAAATPTDDGLARAQSVIDNYRQKPVFTAPGPAFDARACAAGKKMLSMPNSSANPFLKGIIRQEISAGRELGLAVTEWENQGQPNQWVQGMNFAVQGHFTMVDLISGVNPRLIEPQIKAAADGRRKNHGIAFL